MIQVSHKKNTSEFTFQQNQSKVSQYSSGDPFGKDSLIDQNFLFNIGSFEQQLEALKKDQQIDQKHSLNKKLFAPIKKEQFQKVIKFFKKYEPIYFNRIIIKQMSFKFKKGVYIKKYKQGFYFGEVVELKNHQKQIRKIKQGKGVFVYNLFDKGNLQSKRIYEGEWESDKRNGLGFQKFIDGSVYHGNYQNNKPEGRGKLTNSVGQIYEGQWKNGIKQGKGFWQGINGETFMGEWKNGKPNGYSVFVNKEGNRYEGEFKDGFKHGEGIQKFINGDIYKGFFLNDQPHGYGQYFWKNKSYFKGIFSNGLRSGQGLWKKGAGNCDRYEGQYQNDKKWGYGVFTWANGNIFKGNYEGDLRNGYGQMFWNDGSYYKGNWKNGIQHGKGELFVVGEGLRVGQFENNEIIQVQYQQPWQEQQNQINQTVEKKKTTKVVRNHSKDSTSSLKSKKSVISALTKIRPPFEVRSSLEPIKSKPSQLSFTVASKNQRNKIRSQTQSGIRSVPLKSLIKKDENPRYFSKMALMNPNSGFRIRQKKSSMHILKQGLEESPVSHNQKSEQRKNRILHSSFYLHKLKKIGQKNHDESPNSKN